MFINIQLFSVDYYKCDCCGKVFSDWDDDCHFCDCGKHYCSDECAEKCGFKEDLYSTCNFCRKEDFNDSQLLDYLLDKLDLSKEVLKSEMKKGAK